MGASGMRCREGGRGRRGVAAAVWPVAVSLWGQGRLPVADVFGNCSVALGPVPPRAAIAHVLRDAGIARITSGMAAVPSITVWLAGCVSQCGSGIRVAGCAFEGAEKELAFVKASASGVRLKWGCPRVWISTGCRWDSRWGCGTFVFVRFGFRYFANPSATLPFELLRASPL